MLTSIGTNSYASSKIHYEKQKINSKTIPIEADLNQVLLPVVQEFHMPCPPGSHGEGYTFIITHDSDGNVTGEGWYGAGCENDDPSSAPPIT